MSTDQNPSTPPVIIPGDWFTLFLRVLGIWQLIAGVDGVTGLIAIVNIKTGLSQPAIGMSVEAFMTHTLAYLLIGLLLLLGAPAISRLFYPEKGRFNPWTSKPPSPP
jgi:hypothetical protein